LEITKSIMSTIIDHPSTDTDRDRKMTQWRQELIRRAEALGVKPVTSLAELTGNPELTGDFDVEKFLRQVRQDRDRASTRSVE